MTSQGLTPAEKERFRYAIALFKAEPAHDPLHIALTTGVEALRSVGQGDHVVWGAAAKQVLATYIEGMLLWGFDDGRTKTLRQLDIDRCVESLDRTPAGELIRSWCVGAIEGRAWQVYDTMFKPRRRRITPRKLLGAIIGKVARRAMRIIPRPPALGLAVSIIPLLDPYGESIESALLSYVASTNDEWDVVEVARLASRPGASAYFVTGVAAAVMSRSFSNPSANDEAVGRMALLSDEALERLIDLVDAGTGTSDGPEYLARAAQRSGRAMTAYVGWVAARNDYLFSIRLPKTLDQLVSLDLSAAQAVVEQCAAGSEQAVYTVVNAVRTLTSPARSYLRDLLATADSQTVRIAAAIVLLSAPGDEFGDVLEVLEALRRSIVGDGAPTSTDANDIITFINRPRDPSTTPAVAAYLKGAADRPDLVAALLTSSRSKWLTLVAAALMMYEGTASLEELEPAASAFLDGDLRAFRALFRPARNEDAAEHVAGVFERGEHHRALYHEINSGDPLLDVTERLLSQIVLRYLDETQRTADAMAYVASSFKGSFIVHAALAGLAVMPRSLALENDAGASNLVLWLRSLAVVSELLEHPTNGNAIALLSAVQLASTSGLALVGTVLNSLTECDDSALALIERGLQTDDSKVARSYTDALLRFRGLSERGTKLLSNILLDPQTFHDHRIERDQLRNPAPVVPEAVPRVVSLLEAGLGLEDSIQASWIGEYCLLIMGAALANQEWEELLLRIIQGKYGDHDFRKHLRPYAILALGRLRPVSDATLQLLFHESRKGTARLTTDFEWTEMFVAAARSLAEVGADLSNQLDWHTRASIANHLTEIARRPISKTYFVGGKAGFAENANDEIYKAAKLMHSVVAEWESSMPPIH